MQTVGQSREPIGICCLYRQQFVDGVAPSLGAAASVDSAAGAGSDRHWLRQLACSIARLPFGVAQRLFALGFTASRHGSVLRYVTHCNGLDRPVWFADADALHSTASGLRRLLPVNVMRWELSTHDSRLTPPS